MAFYASSLRLEANLSGVLKVLFYYGIALY